MPSIDRRLRQLRVFLEGLGKRRRRALGELGRLIGRAAVVKPHCLGVKARLRTGHRRSRREKSNG